MKTEWSLVVPDHDSDSEVYPGGIEPGRYDINEVVELLRAHKHDPEAIQFIADMMEE